MKVIFLDIDGVLNTSETFRQRRLNFAKTGIWTLEVDEFRFEYLKRIIDETDAKIVLSSTWRLYFDKQNDVVVSTVERGKELNRIFNKYGMEIYDYTTKDNYLRRDDQIIKWLNEHDDVESFIILDDEESHLIKFVGKEFINTTIISESDNKATCLGLCEEHIDIAISKLNKVKVKKLK